MPVNIDKNNNTEYKRLAFVLKNRNSPALFFIKYDVFQTRKHFYNKLLSDGKIKNFFDIYLTGQKIHSLSSSIIKNLRKYILEPKTVIYEETKKFDVINIFDLDHSLFNLNNENLVYSNTIKELNFEREVLFNDLPFKILVWVDQIFFNEVRNHAEDLWDWVDYRFSFKSNQSKSIPIKINRNISGNIYAEKHSHQLLMEDYAKFLQLEEVEKYKKAISILVESISKYPCSDEQLMSRILYKLGTSYLKTKNHKQALEAFKESYQFQIKINDKQLIATTFHQIGITYSQLRYWNNALLYYSKSLQFKKEIGEKITIGNTYHQIGDTFLKIRQFDEALKSFKIAIKYDKKSKHLVDIGNTYHQVGIIFLTKNDFDRAINNFKISIEYKKRNFNTIALGVTYDCIGLSYLGLSDTQTAEIYFNKALQSKFNAKNYHSIGNTYHNIGRLFALQFRWLSSLSNLRRALKWKKETDQKHTLSSTYHQIGLVLIQLDKLNLAMKYFLSAYHFSRYSFYEHEKWIYIRSIRNIKKYSSKYFQEVTNIDKTENPININIDALKDFPMIEQIDDFTTIVK